MVKKSFIIILCFLFLFTWTFVPEAFARERRGGGADLTPVYIIAGVAVTLLIVFMLGLVTKRSSPQKETPKTQGKTNTMAKQVLLEQDNIDNINSVSFRF